MGASTIVDLICSATWAFQFKRSNQRTEKKQAVLGGQRPPLRIVSFVTCSIQNGRHLSASQMPHHRERKRRKLKLYVRDLTYRSNDALLSAELKELSLVDPLTGSCVDVPMASALVPCKVHSLLNSSFCLVPHVMFVVSRALRRAIFIRHEWSQPPVLLGGSTWEGVSF